MVTTEIKIYTVVHAIEDQASKARQHYGNEFVESLSPALQRAIVSEKRAQLAGLVALLATKKEAEEIESQKTRLGWGSW